MIEKLQELFVDITGNNNIILTKKTKIDDLTGTSSFVKIQLICAVEEAFDIEVPNEDLKNMKTVQDLIDVIEKLKS